MIEKLRLTLQDKPECCDAESSATRFAALNGHRIAYFVISRKYVIEPTASQRRIEEQQKVVVHGIVEDCIYLDRQANPLININRISCRKLAQQIEHYFKRDKRVEEVVFWP